MHYLVKILVLSALLLLPKLILAQSSHNNDVFTPIGKYIVKGDAECLSAWFDENLEISVSSKESNASRSQAKHIVKNFFEQHTPQAFSITHSAEKSNMKYALGTLDAGGETFSVTIFLREKGESYRIQQFKIERR